MRLVSVVLSGTVIVSIILSGMVFSPAFACWGRPPNPGEKCCGTRDCGQRGF